MHEHPDGVPAQPDPQPQSQPEPQPQPQPQPEAQLQPAPQSQLPSPPPSQPTAYPYPSPQSPAGYGTHAGPVPTQHNPYAPPPGAFPPPAPPSAGSGPAGRAVLWAALGAVVASAGWAGGVFLLGGDPEADLRGYESKANLCSSVDYSSVKSEYPEEDGSPVHNSLEHEALDQSYCSISLKASSASSYADAYFSVQVDLHKRTDPAPEFTALWSEYDQRYDDYDVDELSGFGDEAYLVTEDTTTGSGTSGSRAVTLAVRDGWMTYQMSWSAYSSSYDEEDVPEVNEVARWLKADTESTLEKLKSD
ncbi:hypothetical protein [Streptomyces cavernae]|uniref:hypothetical protein n=1 Tax=Streptomyces cavernae TaxID=2259034 RepID=UPI000FEBD0F1|nr:hypothetical protein [Streptomyces cavernae]